MNDIKTKIEELRIASIRLQELQESQEYKEYQKYQYTLMQKDFGELQELQEYQEYQKYQYKLMQKAFEILLDNEETTEVKSKQKIIRSKSGEIPIEVESEQERIKAESELFIELEIALEALLGNKEIIITELTQAEKEKILSYFKSKIKIIRVAKLEEEEEKKTLTELKKTKTELINLLTTKNDFSIEDFFKIIGINFVSIIGTVDLMLWDCEIDNIEKLIIKQIEAKKSELQSLKDFEYITSSSCKEYYKALNYIKSTICRKSTEIQPIISEVINEIKPILQEDNLDTKIKEFLNIINSHCINLNEYLFKIEKRYYILIDQIKKDFLEKFKDIVKINILEEWLARENTCKENFVKPLRDLRNISKKFTDEAKVKNNAQTTFDSTTRPSAEFIKIHLQHFINFIEEPSTIDKIMAIITKKKKSISDGNTIEIDKIENYFKELKYILNGFKDISKQINTNSPNSLSSNEIEVISLNDIKNLNKITSILEYYKSRLESADSLEVSKLEASELEASELEASKLEASKLEARKLEVSEEGSSPLDPPSTAMDYVELFAQIKREISVDMSSYIDA